MRFDDDPTPKRLRLMQSMDGFAARRPAAALEMTPGQEARFTRDAAIACLRRNGFSNRQVRDLFGLSKARVSAIESRLSAMAARRFAREDA